MNNLSYCGLVNAKIRASVKAVKDLPVPNKLLIEFSNILKKRIFIIINHYFFFRYGLIGENGSGKSSLLAVLGNKEVPIQDHIDVYYLQREIAASEKTALQAVMEADAERIKLEKLAEELVLR